MFLELLLLVFLMNESNEAAEQKDTNEQTVSETIQVTASGFESLISEAPGEVTVISQEQIKEKGATNLIEAIQGHAGLFFSGEGVGGRKTITIRGLNDKHALILIDGKRIAASNAVMGHSDFEYSWIPVNSIERIEIVRGPLSALYGSEAVGGVINVITKEATPSWKSSIELGGGVREDDRGGESTRVGFYTSGPLSGDKVSLQVAATYSKNESVPFQDVPYSEIEGSEVTSVSTGLDVTLNENHFINFDATFTQDDRWRDASSRGKEYLGEYDLAKQQFSLAWKGIFSKVMADVKLYYSEIDKDAISTYKSGRVKKSTDLVSNQVLEARFYSEMGSHRLSYGGELRKEHLESATLTTKEDDAQYQALFIQDEWSTGKLLLTTGIRMDDHEFFGSEVSPRVYGVYELTENWNLKAGYGEAFNAPTLKQISPNYHARFGPHQFFGNPDLKPETSKNAEVGFHYQRARIHFRAIYFDNKIKDMIAWNKIGQEGHQAIYEGINIDKASTSGVELEYDYHPPCGFQMSGQLTFLDAKDDTTDEDLLYKPEQSGNIRLAYLFSGMNMKFGINGRYIGKQLTSGSELSTVSLPSYSILDLFATKRFNDMFEAQLYFKNITDKYLLDESDDFGYVEPGRSYGLILRASF
ncbi:MAG: hypothetical protein CR997_08245 [Acidobacteria bacterium]|nr:MAG: hypothetical protein CR997_08245 [Acidobacteriota bacterium]